MNILDKILEILTTKICFFITFLIVFFSLFIQFFYNIISWQQLITQISIEFFVASIILILFKNNKEQNNRLEEAYEIILNELDIVKQISLIKDQDEEIEIAKAYKFIPKNGVRMFRNKKNK